MVKPAGVLAQGDSTGDTSLLEMAKAYIKEAYAKPGAVYLGLVHRLDRPVSGVMVFARTSKAAARLSEQFRRRSVDKFYQAVVEGRPPADEGRLVHYLADGGGTRRKTVAHEQEAAGRKRAEMTYRVLERGRYRSLLEVKLLTGVKHQIRAQLAAVGCPVVGDFKYDQRQRPAQPERLAEGRVIALHASRLEFEHPTRRERTAFAAPIPPYWPLL